METWFSESEVDLIEQNELELFERFPYVYISKFEREHSQIHEILGTRVKSIYNTNLIPINADYDREKKVNELQDGVWVKTNRIQLRFNCRQLKEKGLTLERGDIIVFPFNTETERYELLSIEYADFIPSVHIPLHLIGQIDISHKFSD